MQNLDVKSDKITVGVAAHSDPQIKNNANPVGADASVRPHFEEMTLKNQKGITLIALIITIIVMLILVGVTINVALNGGLFEKAETATKETEEKAILEEMLAMMEITYEGKFDYNTIILNMRTNHPEYEVAYSYPNAKITGKLGTYNYIVSETEIKIGASNTVDEKLAKYLLGADLQGRNFMELMDESYTLKDDPDTEEDESQYGVEFLGMVELNDFIEERLMNTYFKYESKVYKVLVDQDMITQKTPGLVEVYSPTGREGEKITIGGEEWTIIYDNGTNVEVVSPTVLGNLTLGEADTQATGSTSLERAIDSYNNAITRINQYCKDQISDDIATDSKIRSVGVSTDTAGYLRESNIPGYTVGTDTWFKNYDNLIKLGGYNYEQDIVRMAYHNSGGNGEEFWVASRWTDFVQSFGRYSVAYAGGMNSLIVATDFTGLFLIDEDEARSNTNLTYGVRPIIKVEI